MTQRLDSATKLTRAQCTKIMAENQHLANMVNCCLTHLHLQHKLCVLSIKISTCVVPACCMASNPQHDAAALLCLPFTAQCCMTAPLWHACANPAPLRFDLSALPTNMCLICGLTSWPTCIPC